MSIKYLQSIQATVSGMSGWPGTGVRASWSRRTASDEGDCGDTGSRKAMRHGPGSMPRVVMPERLLGHGHRQR